MTKVQSSHKLGCKKVSAQIIVVSFCCTDSGIGKKLITWHPPTEWTCQSLENVIMWSWTVTINPKRKRVVYRDHSTVGSG